MWVFQNKWFTLAVAVLNAFLIVFLWVPLAMGGEVYAWFAAAGFAVNAWFAGRDAYRGFRRAHD